MDLIVNFFVTCNNHIFSFLNSIEFSLGGYTMSFFNIMFGALVISIIISVFWKGGKA